MCGPCKADGQLNSDSKSGGAKTQQPQQPSLRASWAKKKHDIDNFSLVVHEKQLRVNKKHRTKCFRGEGTGQGNEIPVGGLDLRLKCASLQALRMQRFPTEKLGVMNLTRVN
jgi:hypothetical protein